MLDSWSKMPDPRAHS